MTPALAEIPSVNAEIDGDEIVYKNYAHIGVAVGTDKGLVVPVVRDADRMGLAEIEGTIADFGRRAREGSAAHGRLESGALFVNCPICRTPTRDAHTLYARFGFIDRDRLPPRGFSSSDMVLVRTRD